MKIGVHNFALCQNLTKTLKLRILQVQIHPVYYLCIYNDDYCIYYYSSSLLGYNRVIIQVFQHFLQHSPLMKHLCNLPYLLQSGAPFHHSPLVQHFLLFINPTSLHNITRGHFSTTPIILRNCSTLGFVRDFVSMSAALSSVGKYTGISTP